MVNGQLEHAALAAGAEGDVAVADGQQLPVTNTVSPPQEAGFAIHLDHDAGERRPGDDADWAHAVERDGRRGSRGRSDGRWRWPATSDEQGPLRQHARQGVDGVAWVEAIGLRAVQLWRLRGRGLPGATAQRGTRAKPLPWARKAVRASK